MLELFAVRGQLAVTLLVHATVAAAAWSASLLAADAHHRGEEGDAWMARAALGAKVSVATGALVMMQLPVFWSVAIGTAGLGVFVPLVVAFALVVGRAAWLAGEPKPTRGFGALLMGTGSGFIGLLVLGWLAVPHLATVTDDGAVSVPLQALWTNTAGWARVVHVALGALALGSAFFAAGAARRGKVAASQRALVFVLLALFVQPLAGMMSWRVVGLYQPVKVAAMGAHWETAASADVQIGSWPYDFGEFSREGVRVSGALSQIVHGDAEAEVAGLLDFPMEGRPPVAALHLGHQGMMLMWLVAMVLASVGWNRTRKGHASRWLLGVGLVPATFAAWFFGWLVAELGRQPWTIRGVLRVGDAVWLPRGIAPASFVVLSLVSVFLAVNFIIRGRRLGAS